MRKIIYLERSEWFHEDNLTVGPHEQNYDHMSDVQKIYLEVWNFFTTVCTVSVPDKSYLCAMHETDGM